LSLLRCEYGNQIVHEALALSRREEQVNALSIVAQRRRTRAQRTAAEQRQRLFRKRP
jgi:hypothetical protein